MTRVPRKRNTILLTEIAEEPPPVLRSVPSEKVARSSLLLSRIKSFDLLALLASGRQKLWSLHPGRQSLVFAGAAVLIAAFVLSLLRTEDGAASESTTVINQLLAEQQQLRSELSRLRSEMTQAQPAPGEESVAASASSEKTGADGAVTPREYFPDGSDRDDPFLGPKNSKVVVMVFSDYQCKLCRDFHNSTLPKLRSEFVDNGSVKLIYRDFPLSSNPHAKRAAAFAHCAGEQGAYWKAFELLSRNENAVSSGAFAKLLPELKGLDHARLAACLHSKKYDAEADADSAQALALGAKGAPSTFVGTRTPAGSFQGVFIRGAQPFAVLEQEIQRAVRRTQ